MNTFFKQITKFTGIGIFLYFFFALIIPPFLVKNYYPVEWRTKLFMKDSLSLDSVDVLILGSSHAFKSFDPRVFKGRGYQSLTLASPSQTPEGSYFVLKDFFDGALSKSGSKPIPKVIVHELYCKTISDKSSLESYIKSVENYPSTYNFFKLGLLTGDVTAVNMFFSTMLKKTLGLYEEKRTYKDAPEYVNYGYYKTSGSRKKTEHQRYDVPIESLTFENEFRKVLYKREKVRDRDICKNAPTEYQLAQLEKIISLSREHSVPVVLVVAPMPVDFTSNIKDYSKILDNLSVFAKKNNVALITDFSSLKLNEDTEFADRDHLNNLGAQRFSKLFLEELVQKGLLK